MIDAATLQLVLDEERVKFQRETLRTSELSQALQKLINIHREEHTKGPWSRGCWRCDAVAEAEELLAAPLPALKPMADMVMVPSTLLNDIRAIADTGGRRIETAMDACDKIIELIDMERQLGPAASPAPSDEGVVEKVRKILEEIETETNRATREFHGNSYSAAFAHNRARAALAAINGEK